MKRAKTVAAANAQQFVVPVSLDAWRTFAGLIDGYAIAEELGIDLGGWAAEHAQLYAASGEWQLDVLGLRLMLFVQFRADYMGGYTYHERDPIVESLLQALREKRQDG